MSPIASRLTAVSEQALSLVYDGRVARPSALTPELRERIELELSDGIPIVVAQNVGVGRSTLHSWLSSGRVVRRPPAGPLELVREDPAERLDGVPA